MEQVLARNWGWVALRGVIALIFGFLTLRNPLMALSALILLFGAYSLADGILSVIAAVANRRGQPHWVALLLGGVAGIIIGIVTFIMPAITGTILLLFIAAWALVIGVAQVVAAIRLRKVISGEWMLALAGVISVLFGLLLVARPAAGALVVVFWIGAYAVISGLVLIALAFRLRSWGREHPVSATPRAA